MTKLLWLSLPTTCHVSSARHESVAARGLPPQANLQQKHNDLHITGTSAGANTHRNETADFHARTRDRVLSMSAGAEAGKQGELCCITSQACETHVAEAYMTAGAQARSLEHSSVCGSEVSRR